MHLNAFKHGTGQRSDMTRQLRAERRKAATRMEYCAKRLHISECARGAKLYVQATALLVVRALQHRRDARRHQILEAAGVLLGAVGVAGHERVLDLRA